MSEPTHNLLVISDLHLGEHLRVEAGSERASLTDQALIEFLEHHAAHREGGRPWRLVVNGDMVDFVAVRLMPCEAGMVAGLHDNEHAYGLSDNARGGVAKMRAVLSHHEPVFRAMARFVGAGNGLHLVIGNHDAAFHWPEVQELLRHALAALWAAEQDAGARGLVSASEVFHAVEFHPWFWFEPGVAWIEHGHQFDPYCAFEDVAAPATDERSLDPNIGGALMHYVGNHYLADMEHYWGKGFFGYLSFWVSQGWWRGAEILGAYRDMCMFLMRTWWERRPLRVAARKRRNRARIERLAAKARLPVDVLLRLRSLHRRPAASDLDAIVRAVMLDRLLLLVSVPVLAVFVLLTQPDPFVAALICGAVLGPLATLSARPRDPVDPKAAMRRVSEVIRRVARVPIVVFGHSHAPAAEHARDGSYFNTGSWVGDPDGPGKAFTHLRVLRTPAGPLARLCQWRPGGALELD